MKSKMSNEPIRVERKGRYKKIFGNLAIPIEFIPRVMDKAGYKPHRTFENNYVRDLGYQKRLHAVAEGENIEIHLDRTNVVSNKHYVADWEKFIAIERRRVRQIYREIDPNWRPINKKESRELKDIVAPNLKELQKWSSTLNANIKPQPFWRRLFSRLTPFLTKRNRR